MSETREDTLQTIRTMISFIDLLERVGVNVDEVIQARSRARAEGRDLTDEELAGFRSQAAAAIEEAKGA